MTHAIIPLQFNSNAGGAYSVYDDEETRLLFRSMQPGPDGLPATGASARLLGARPEIDIVINAEGTVRPGGGGLSVAPEVAGNLPRHRLPRGLGGTGKDPVWSIDEAALGRRLRYRPDPDNPLRHGFIGPAEAMPFDDYQQALADTRPLWQPFPEK